jgi:hypothetical protein
MPRSSRRGLSSPRTDAAPQSDLLLLQHGHPGRVSQLNHGVHLIVSRVGLEDADIRQVIGYGMDDVGVIDDATFTRRAEAARAGFLPP